MKNTIKPIIDAIANANNWILTSVRDNGNHVSRKMVDEYASTIRPILNKEIFTNVVGVTIIEDKDGKGGKIKLNGDLISNEDKKAVMKALEEFQTSIEIPFTSSIEDVNAETLVKAQAEAAEEQADDMDIVEAVPSKPGRFDYACNRSLFGEKTKLKDLYQLVSSDSFVGVQFGTSSIEELYELGDSLRKKRLIKTMIIGGSIAVVAAAGVITYMIINNKQNNNDDSDECDINDDIDIDDDVPVVETDTSSSFMTSMFGYSV